MNHQRLMVADVSLLRLPMRRRIGTFIQSQTFMPSFWLTLNAKKIFIDFVEAQEDLQKKDFEKRKHFVA